METILPSTNYLVLRSMPVPKDLKRFFVNRYCRLVRENGLEFANSRYEDLLTSLKVYQSRGKFPSCGIRRRSGWVKRLKAFSTSSPNVCLNFVSSFTQWDNPENSSVKAEKKLRATLLDAEERAKLVPALLPKELDTWYKFLGMSTKGLSNWYDRLGSRPKHPFQKARTWHTRSQWLAYWAKWKSILTKTRSLSPDSTRHPFPWVYKDYDGSFSDQFDQDLHHLPYALMGMPLYLRHRIIRNLSEDSRYVVTAIAKMAGLDLQAAGWSNSASYVMGQIHFVYKSSSSLRPIAVPNRFLQPLLDPIAGKLSAIVKRVPVDAAYDQAKFDGQIQARLQTHRWVCSLDLKSATEYMPLDWIRPLISLQTLTEEEELSWITYVSMSRGNWHLGQKEPIRWSVGQPLGTVPSFSVLSLTHLVLLESLSLSCGYLFSPYRILGDDLVVFSRSISSSYRKVTESFGLRLSESKTLSGRAVEFAGKFFRRSSRPFYTPKVTALSWSNLFDWQTATGIGIPYRHLPVRLKRRIGRVLSQQERRHDSFVPRTAYRQASLARVFDRSCRTEVLSSADREFRRMFWHLHQPDEDWVDADPKVHTGIVYSRLVNLVMRPFFPPNALERDVFYYAPQLSLPKWFREKFRPCTTDATFSLANEAMVELDVNRSFQSWKESFTGHLAE